MYLGTEMVDLVGGEGDRSMWGLRGGLGGVVSPGDGGGCERGSDLGDIRRGTVDDGGMTIWQLATGVALNERWG